MDARGAWALRESTGSTRDRLVAVLLAGLVAGACGSDRSGEPIAGDGRGDPAETELRRLPDSVRRVDDPAPAWEEPARLELVREVRGRAVTPGSPAGTRRPTLSSIRDVAPAGDGGTLVLDGSDARVLVLDSAGRLRDRLGGRGPGPGELRTPDRVEAAPDGGFLVLERRPAAVHRWRDGEYRGALTLTRNASAQTAAAPSDVTELADWGPGLADGRAVRLIRLHASDPSSSVSAVHVMDAGGRIAAPAVTWTTPGTRSRLPEVFGSRRSWTAGMGPDGRARFAVARGDRYEIRLHDSSGALGAVIRRRVEPVAVTDALRERALDQFVEEAGRAGAPPGMIRELRDQIPVARALPVIGDLWHSDPEGRLWVGLVGPGDHSGAPSVVRAYDVFGPDLRYLGNVPAPPGFELHRVDGELLYGSRRDSLDVPGVEVYRLVEPPDRTAVSAARGRP